MQTKDKKSISVIMPALNEGENIEKAVKDVLDTFTRLGIEGEVVIVDDGSRDNTFAKAKKFLSSSQGKVKILTHSIPQGIGASFWDGVKEASGETVVMLPGDGENDAYEILKYLELTNYVDIIVPYITNKNIRSPIRNFLSSLFLLIINISFGLWLNYTNGTVIYKKQVLESLCHKEKGFFYQVEVLVKAIKKGYTFAEVPCKLAKREGGISKAVSLATFADILRGYLRLIKEIYFPCRWVKKS
ncbi:MAG: hypothetical protein B6D56_03635 [Candidatus Omnitrophica bacterium 4484_70.1]|nr:MAG: hypothetical protein B6D56_03635 [Candidatus Omnitrophica bacterium 4484_70.1]